MPRKSTTIRVVGLCLCIALLAAACAGGDDDAQPEATATTDESAATTVPGADTPEPTATEVPLDDVPLGPSDVGVTATTITIGIPSVDVEALQEFGLLEDLEGFDPIEAFETAIAHVNDRGGINGRTLDAVYAEFLPIGQAQADAACIELVQDNDVFAVLGTLIVPEGVLCYTQLNDTPFVGIIGSLTQEIIEGGSEPAIATSALVADLQLAMFDYAESQGELSRPIAVHGDDRATIDWAADELRDRGTNVVSLTTVSAPGTDQAARLGEFEQIFERWRSDGAEVVLNVGTALDLVVAMGDEEFYIDVYASEGSAFNYTPEEEPELEAARRLTIVSGVPPLEEGDHGPTDACTEAWDSRHPDQVLASIPDQIFTVQSACAGIELLAAVAEAAGNDLTHESFAAAISVVEVVDLPQVGELRIAGDGRLGPTVVSVARWDDEELFFAPMDSVPLG